MLKAKYGWKVAVEGTVDDRDIFYNILKNRGIDDAERFFNMGKEALYSPFLLNDMEKAVTRIQRAITHKEPILIFGDYDCDGITAISVLFRALKQLGANVFYDLPNRFSDGYGLNMKATEEIIQNKYKLVITVDNGITCVQEVKNLQNAGIDCIITDHHEIKETIPEAFAIIHAKLSPNYPWKEMAGVAVAYKLACAVSNSDLDDLLDLVMIGTIADLMPLKDENQALVNLGLKQLKKSVHPGLNKLLQHSHLDQINETAIAFKIAPKINSSGRLGKALDAVKLLVTDSDEEANRLIIDIEQNHSTRKDLTEDAFLTCERVMDPLNHVLVIASATLHEGIIGICAQKIAEKYQKSTCVIYLDDEGIGKGSCRAYGGDNILEMLDANADILIKYGGHSQAAGLTIKASNIAILQERLNHNQAVSVQPILNVDMRVKLASVSFPTVKKLEKYSFFTGTYLFENLIVKSKQLLANKHTKLAVMDNDQSFEAIIFNNQEYYYHLEVGDVVSIVGGLSINQWKSKESLQIMIKDLKCDDFQVLDFRHQPDESLLIIKNFTDSILIDDEFMKTQFQSVKLPIIDHPMTLIVGPLKCYPNITKALSKDHLGQIYKVINTMTECDTQKLIQLVGGSEWTVSTALKIFTDLFLIQCEHGKIKVSPSKEKKNLEESATYQNLLKIKQNYEFILESPYPAIKSYFKKLMEVTQ